MAELTTAVCSITSTQRRRFFWAAWWTEAPCHTPFRKPDAANGGARSREAALAEAEKMTGRHLTLIEGYWARAFICVMRGQPVPPLPAAKPAQPARERAQSAWTVLGVEPGASAQEIRRAFHAKALQTHPDQGGDAERFRAVMRAFERLTRKGKRFRAAAGKR